MKLLTCTAIGTMAMCMLASCRSVSPGLLAGEWEVTSLGNRQVTASTSTPYLGFADSLIYGFTGCNRLTVRNNAEALKKGKIDFSRVATTLMACPDAPYETAFMEALSKATKVRTEGDRMQLSDGDRNVVMELTRRKLTAEGLHGEWNVVELQGRPVPQEDDDVPFLGFDTKNGRLYGFTGCNRMTGSIRLEELLAGRADFSRIGTTRMLCADDRYEAVLLSTLSDVRTVTSRHGFLILEDGKGKILVKLSRAERK